MRDFKFVIYRDNSRSDEKIVLKPFSEILNAAEWVLRRSGDSFEDLAGIKWLEDSDGNLEPEREMTREEVINVCSELLAGEHGGFYLIFDTNEEGTRRFAETAEEYGLLPEATDLIRHVS